jgi:hypothetical protein
VVERSASVEASEAAGQGDQIGRIFANLAIPYFRNLFESCKSSPNCCATLFHGKGVALILTKNGIGNILGDFFLKLIWSPCRQTTFNVAFQGTLSLVMNIWNQSAVFNSVLT